MGNYRNLEALVLRPVSGGALLAAEYRGEIYYQFAASKLLPLNGVDKGDMISRIALNWELPLTLDVLIYRLANPGKYGEALIVKKLDGSEDVIGVSSGHIIRSALNRPKVELKDWEFNPEEPTTVVVTPYGLSQAEGSPGIGVASKNAEKGPVRKRHGLFRDLFGEDI